MLERPIRSSALLAAVNTALRSRFRQYQVRDDLARRLESENTVAAIFETTTLGVAQADPATNGVRQLTKDLFESPLFSTVLVPMRDGLTISRKK